MIITAVWSPINWIWQYNKATLSAVNTYPKIGIDLWYMQKFLNASNQCNLTVRYPLKLTVK